MNKTTEVQINENGYHVTRRYFCSWYLRALNDVLSPELTFFTDKAWFHLRGCINAQRIRAVLI
jgi:hypothetical protein